MRTLQEEIADLFPSPRLKGEKAVLDDHALQTFAERCYLIGHRDGEKHMYNIAYAEGYKQGQADKPYNINRLEEGYNKSE